jgi:2-keto-3-deoxy-L-rhamnonate aldolase RhmA
MGGRNEGADPFTDGAGNPRVLFGVTVLSDATRMAELAGLVGFDGVWIEMEHGPAGFKEAEALCLAAEARGALPAIRISDGQRTHVLRAVETGARIVIVPMVNDAAAAREVVRYGKYPPVGQRGFNTRSRGVDYGMDDLVPSFARANARTHLFTQVEDMEAVRNLDAILAVEGLSGIFIGPGDLSVSMGRTAAFSDPELIRVVTDCARRARAAGRHCGIMAAPGPLLDAALEAGSDLNFVGGDLADLTPAWRTLLASCRAGARG